MNPIILALDYSNLDDADMMLDKVSKHIGMIKVGLELFTAHGWECLKLAEKYSKPIFLDLKLFDIPTTVAKTVRVACQRLADVDGPHFLSVHTMGTKEMCKAALEASTYSNVKITGITLLTSFSWQDLSQLGYSDTRVNIQTSHFARLGRSCTSKDWKSTEGLTHFVCGPSHVPLLRKHLGNEVTIITPGIRPPDTAVNDHKNSATIPQALKNGANWLVIGRPITQDADPAFIAEQFAEVALKNAG